MPTTTPGARTAGVTSSSTSLGVAAAEKDSDRCSGAEVAVLPATPVAGGASHAATVAAAAAWSLLGAGSLFSSAPTVREGAEVSCRDISNAICNSASSPAISPSRGARALLSFVFRAAIRSWVGAGVVYVQVWEQV